MNIFHCYYHTIAGTVQGISSSQHAMHRTELKETLLILSVILCCFFMMKNWEELNVVMFRVGFSGVARTCHCGEERSIC